MAAKNKKVQLGTVTSAYWTGEVSVWVGPPGHRFNAVSGALRIARRKEILTPLAGELSDIPQDATRTVEKSPNTHVGWGMTADTRTHPDNIAKRHTSTPNAFDRGTATITEPTTPRGVSVNAVIQVTDQNGLPVLLQIAAVQLPPMGKKTRRPRRRKPTQRQLGCSVGEA